MESDMTDKTTTHKTIAAALAAAQLEMGKALKQANNPHFKKAYADLGNVMDACLGPLNRHGIAVIQPAGEGERGRYVKTVFIHGESTETLECEIPLIIGKNDMQGYGSAVTYARRYGLMSMAGIAPEDDDGNDAVVNAPHNKPTPRKVDPKPEPKPDPAPKPPATGGELRDQLKGWMQGPKTTPDDIRDAWNHNASFKAKRDSLSEPMQNELKTLAEKICGPLDGETGQ
jgi:hypothetical protein